MPNCNRCGKEIKWREPYVKGDKPLNMDDTPHQCSAPAKPSGSARPETPIEQIVAEIQAIKAEIGEIKDMNTEVALVEGIWKYAISRKMQR